MPRPPRIQFAGANYHIVTRGDGRRKLFHDTRHYERFTKGLEDEVQRSGGIVLAYCWMPNHVHALIQTPEPNLARGMQHWLSGYANWYAKRNRRTGHLYQGRYKAFLVEDAGYYWTLSRYIHLDPCHGSKPLEAILNHGGTAVSQATLARANVSVGSPTINFTPIGTLRWVEKILHAHTAGMGSRRGQALCSVFEECSLGIVSPESQQGIATCLDHHEFSSRAPTITSSPAETVVENCSTTRDTTNASPKGSRMKFSEADGLSWPIAGCRIISTR